MTGRKGEPDDDRIVSGRRPVAELLRSGAGAEKVLLAEGLAPAAVLTEIRKTASASSIPVRVVPRAELDRLTGGNHQGVVAVGTRYRYASLSRLLSSERACVLFLDGITDPHNLGSLLRSAEGAGFHGAVIPARRSVAVTAAVRRVSAGAAEVIPVARVDNLSTAIDEAKRMGLWIVGLDQEGPDDIWTSNLPEPPVGLVLGSEGRGLSPKIQSHCDATVRIPHYGRIESLNVAVAGAVAMFEVARRREGSGNL